MAGGAARSTSNNEERPKGRDLNQLRQLIVYLRPYKSRVAYAGLSLILAAASVLSIGIGLRYVIDSGIASGNVNALNHSLNAILIVIATLALSTFFRSYLVTWLGERVVADIRSDVFRHVIRLSPGFFEVTRVGEVLSRLTADTSVIQTVIGSSVTQALRNILLTLGGLCLLAYTSPRLTGFVLLVVPVVVLPIIILGRRVRRLSRLSQDRVADVSGRGEEAISAIRTVQAFAQEDAEAAHFTNVNNQAFMIASKRARTRALLAAVVISLVFGAVVCVLWMGGQDVVNDRLSAGELSSFVFFATIVASAIGGLSEIFGDLQRASGATERLFELLDMKSDIQAPEHPRQLVQPLKGAITFEDVTFCYPTKPQMPALQNLSVSLKPGETTALVGPSGAGKTSVLQLLMRFFDPAIGQITVDGCNIAELDPAAFRAQIGFVSQEPVIFSTSALENIRYGKPDAGDMDVKTAARAAAADLFIEALPAGYDTFLGEKGVRLSGGERQRIAIARAILKDPTILLLDEATSALDSENEKAVQEALIRLMQNRTSLVIAHRLSTIIHADRILVLDQGRLVEQGAHSELARRDGLYARLAKLQFTDHPIRGEVRINAPMG